MNILFIRPDPGNERFGLGPFFRVEPLGLEYVAAALIEKGHNPSIIDLRFADMERWIKKTRPEVIGITCMHALEYDEVLRLARSIRRAHPGVFILIGGHTAAAYPDPLQDPAIDAISIDDGEVVVPDLIEAIQKHRPLTDVPGLVVRTPDGFVRSPAIVDRITLDRVPLPARHLVEHDRHRYMVVTERPIYLLETARGCPFRCSFCSIWQLYGRQIRARGIGHVVEDFRRVGDRIFIADDLFLHNPERSIELARELQRKGIKKEWFLVQTRTDVVARHPEVLAEWRKVANRIDIFFGLESASDAGLKGYVKDTNTDWTVKAVEIARSLGCGVTGNFMVDPAFGEDDFQNLWAFVEKHKLQRAGYTIMTPLPGTKDWAQWKDTLAGQPWYKWDMHHVLWQPRLGVERFFELFAETWRRSVLNLGGGQGGARFLKWIAHIEPWQIPQFARIMMQTQRLMSPKAYLKEHHAAERIHRIPPAPKLIQMDDGEKPVANGANGSDSRELGAASSERPSGRSGALVSPSRLVQRG
jgi:hopanoid C-3 methylase